MKQFKKKLCGLKGDYIIFLTFFSKKKKNPNLARKRQKQGKIRVFFLFERTDQTGMVRGHFSGFYRFLRYGNGNFS